MAEFAIILAAIAVVCVFALVFLGGAIQARFDGTGNAIQQAGPTAATPPSAPGGATPVPAEANPTTSKDCDGGGWQAYPQFKSAGECKKYFDTPKPPKP